MATERAAGLISDPSGVEGAPPQRVISLCPAITELLFDIGMKERIIGVSKQCRFPEVRVKDTESVGSSRRPDIRRIQELRPDFIVIDSRETDEAVVRLLKEEFTVWDSPTSTVLGAIAEIRELGRLMDKQANAEWIAGKIETRFAEFQADFARPEREREVVFLASYKPWSAYGAGTLATELLGYIGLVNAWATEGGIFPVEQKRVPGGASTLVLIAEGPYSFHKRHVPVVNKRFPDSRVFPVTEELLTWQGSRLLRTPAYLAELDKILSRG